MKIVKIPFSSGSLGKNIGCELAPDIICKDLNVVNLNVNKNIEETGKLIYDYVKSNSKLFLIGGDHSITYFSFKAFAEKNKDCGLLIFDAHPDVQSSDFLTHEDYLRLLIEEKVISPEKVLIVGVRAISKEELEYLREKRIVYFDMNKIYELGIKEACGLIMERMNKFNGLYLSIDIDAVDPAFAPGTGYIEPGGVSSLDLLYMLNRIKNMRNLGMIDLVEINPKKDFNNLTINLGRKIVEVFL